MGSAGCGKKVDCNIKNSHAHLYTNNNGYTRYINKEYIKYKGYTRDDKYIEIEGEKSYTNF